MGNSKTYIPPLVVGALFLLNAAGYWMLGGNPAVVLLLLTLGVACAGYGAYRRDRTLNSR